MKTNFFQVRATLVPAELGDFYNQNFLIENTDYFLKNTVTGKFIGMYKVDSVNCIACAPGLVCQYCSTSVIQKAVHAHTLKELAYLTSRKILYKVSPINPVDQVYLVVKTAQEFDFFESDRLKNNILYYTISSIGNHTEGPFLSNETHLSKLKALLFKREIYVLSKEQYFNEVQNLKSA